MGEKVRGRDEKGREGANPLQTSRRERDGGKREGRMQSDLSEGRDYIENQGQTPTGC